MKTLWAWIAVLATPIAWTLLVGAFGDREGIVLFVVSCALILIIMRARSTQAWASWPTLEEYWTRNPACRTARGVTCHHCSSYHLVNRGWSEARDRRRVHKCQQCDTMLYRTYR